MCCVRRSSSQQPPAKSSTFAIPMPAAAGVGASEGLGGRHADNPAPTLFAAKPRAFSNLEIEVRVKRTTTTLDELKTTTHPHTR